MDLPSLHVKKRETLERLESLYPPISSGDSSGDGLVNTQNDDNRRIGHTKPRPNRPLENSELIVKSYQYAKPVVYILDYCLHDNFVEMSQYFDNLAHFLQANPELERPLISYDHNKGLMGEGVDLKSLHLKPEQLARSCLTLAEYCSVKGFNPKQFLRVLTCTLSDSEFIKLLGNLPEEIHEQIDEFDSCEPFLQAAEDKNWPLFIQLARDASNKHSKFLYRGNNIGLMECLIQSLGEHCDEILNGEHPEIFQLLSEVALSQKSHKLEPFYSISQVFLHLVLKPCAEKDEELLNYLSYAQLDNTDRNAMHPSFAIKITENIIHYHLLHSDQEPAQGLDQLLLQCLMHINEKKR